MEAEPLQDEAGWLRGGVGELIGAQLTWSAEAGASGVLLLPALGYEQSESYRTVRAVAETCAARGALALRVDYPAAGDSAGSAEILTVAALDSALVAGVRELRARGCTEVTVVGLRVGGLLALMGAAAAGADRVIAWDPVSAGRRHVRELRLLGEPSPPESGLPPGSLTVSGHLLPGPLLAELAALGPADVHCQGLGDVLLAERDDQPPDQSLVAAVSDQLPTARTLRLTDQGDFLDHPAEDAKIPWPAVEALAGEAVGNGRVTPRAPAASTGLLSAVTVSHTPDGEDIVEDRVRLGPRGLVGVRTAVAGVAQDAGGPARTALVFLNSGSDPHHGPGRAWVDLARDLAAPGIEVYRTDFSGWGDSPPRVRSSGRPYDLSAVEDITEIATSLLEAGASRVVLVGLCAGAWVALHTAREAVRSLRGGSPGSGLAALAGHLEVVALNPQLYWNPGDPVEALMSDTRHRRREEIADIAARAAAGEWDTEDRAGLGPEAARWLQELSDARVPVSLLFAEGDDGIDYLRQRIGRRIDTLTGEGRLRVVEMPGVDHSLTRTWLRPQAADHIRSAVRWAQPPAAEASR